MGMIYQDITQLIHIEKSVDVNALTNGSLSLCLDFPVRKRIKLFSSMENIEFLLDIDQSGKVAFKITLHIMDRENNLGLFRLDYCPETKLHRNPDVMTDSIPGELAKYAGLEIWGNHAHFPVPGGKELLWAVPLSDLAEFPKTFDGKQTSLPDIVSSFAKYVNITTEIVFETPVL